MQNRHQFERVLLIYINYTSAFLQSKKGVFYVFAATLGCDNIFLEIKNGQPFWRKCGTGL